MSALFSLGSVKVGVWRTDRGVMTPSEVSDIVTAAVGVLTALAVILHARYGTTTAKTAASLVVPVATMVAGVSAAKPAH